MKKCLCMVLTLLLLAGTTGCGSSPAPAAGEPAPAATSQENSDDPATDAPALSGKVVVYSPHGEEMMDDVADWFKEATGIEMEFIYGGGGELVDRIRAEKSNPQCDVIYGNPTNVYEQMKVEGLLSPYTPTWAGSLADNFKDADGYYYGTMQTPVILFYNHDLLTPEQAPKDWSDLADPRFQGQIVMRSTTSAASRATISALIDQYEQKGTLETEGWQFFQDMDKNIKTYVTDSALMFAEIAKGEAQMGFWTMDNIMTNVRDAGSPFTIVAPESGAVVISDCIAVIEGAKNADNAKAFIDFVGSKEVQLKLADAWKRMPTLPEALAEAPEWMGELEYKALDVNWVTLTEKQPEWLQHFNDEIVDSSKNG